MTDRMEQKIRNGVQAAAEKNGLTFEKAAKIILAWMEATANDPAAVVALRALIANKRASPR